MMAQTAMTSLMVVTVPRMWRMSSNFLHRMMETIRAEEAHVEEQAAYLNRASANSKDQLFEWHTTHQAAAVAKRSKVNVVRSQRAMNIESTLWIRHCMDVFSCNLFTRA